MIFKDRSQAGGNLTTGINKNTGNILKVQDIETYK